MPTDLDKLDKLSADDKKRLELTGLELNMANRSGTCFQMDQDILHAASRYEGIEIYTIADAMENYEGFENYYWKLVAKDKDKYTHYVAEQDKPSGFVIVAKAGSKNVMPLQTGLFLAHEAVQHVHNIFIAEENSELHLITGCVSSANKKKGAHYGITEIYVGEGALVSSTMIHTWGENIEVYPRSAARVEKNGTFLSNYISMKPVKNAQMYPEAHLVGEDAVARFNSVVVAPAGSHLDLGQRAILAAKGTSAELISRVITRGGTVFSRAHIIGETKGTKGHIECKGLILEDGIIHAVPEIEGRVTSTELSHEAAVGKIARDEIEYLMCRGLDEEEATATIIRGFLDVKIKGLPDSLQEQIDAAIDAAESGF